MTVEFYIILKIDRFDFIKNRKILPCLTKIFFFKDSPRNSIAEFIPPNPTRLTALIMGFFKRVVGHQS